MSSFRSAFVALALVAATTLVGCSGGGSSTPLSPSPVTGTQNLLPEGKYIVDPTSGSTVTSNSMVRATMQELYCEKPTYWFGVKYVRDDGVTAPTYTFVPCGATHVTNPNSFIVGLSDPRNGLWDFGRGHRVKIVFQIIENVPATDSYLYQKEIGSLQF